MVRWAENPIGRRYATPEVIERTATIRIEVQSRPQSVTLVRAVLSALAELLSFEMELVNDLKTAVSEACNNVVMHAYGGGSGPLVVQLSVDQECVLVRVCDQGSGIQHVSAAEDRMGVGLAVITALATRAEFASRAGGGTEVRMTFARREPVTAPESLPETDPPAPSPSLAGDVVVSLAPVGLLGEVLGRAARTLAASAHLSLERFSDVYLVSDALAAHARTAAGGVGIGFAISAMDRRLELAVGPLRAGTGQRLQTNGSPDRMRSPLPLLVDELDVEPDEGGEVLRLVMADRDEGLKVG